jgi:LmbE family N-acetylglucosaminyl deacetylase
MQPKHILVLSPHPEDGELGCGGTMVRLLESGCNIYYVAFTIAEKSTHPPFPPDAQRHEMGKALDILGIRKSNIIVKNWEVRKFPEYRQEILEYMITLRKDIRPDLVFCHSRDDSHQDHQVITSESIRAYKQSSILGYELPWNNFHFRSDYFVELTKQHVEKKARAIESYQSRSYRPYLDRKKIFNWMGMRGMQVEADYAECFEVIRMVDRLID